MFGQIKGVTESKNGPLLVDLFGHSTKGIPGLEIVGLGKESKIIKEKFLFISKIKNLKIPLRRYILCVEWPRKGTDLSAVEVDFLELPLLILFWGLAEILPISNMSDCLTSGRVSPQGTIALGVIDIEFIWQNQLQCKTIGQDHLVKEGISNFSIEDLFSEIIPI